MREGGTEKKNEDCDRKVTGMKVDCNKSNSSKTGRRKQEKATEATTAAKGGDKVQQECDTRPTLGDRRKR